MIFIILPVSIFIVGTLLSYFLFIKKITSPVKAYESSLENIGRLVQDRKNILREAAGFSLGLADSEYYQELSRQAEEAKAEINLKKQQMTGIENEILKAELKLKEVEEVNKEVEISQVEAQKETDLLKAQEDDIGVRNAAAKQELQDVIKNISPVFEALASLEGSDALIDALFMQTGNADQKLEFFQKEIATINKKYLELKDQYDTLDIEYAQLYEKFGG